MRNYVIINGVNSLTIQGLAIKTLPPITKPIQRNLREEIDGRDGDIVTTLGYGAYDKTIEIGLFGTFDIDEVIAYFNQKGTITFSNEADKVYYFEALDQVDYAELLKFRTANVVLHCQPFKYPLNETPLVEEYEYVEATGSNVTLDNTSEAIFNKIELQGNTFQQTYTGQNLLPNNAITRTANGITFTKNNDGSITMNGTCTGNVDLYFVGDYANYEDFGLTTGGYNLNGCTGGGEQTYMLFAVLRRNGNLYYYSSVNASGRVMIVEAGDEFRIFIRVFNGQVLNNITIYPQINAGNTALSYIPYVGGIPAPNPDYPQDVHVVSGDNEINICGKNLFDNVLSSSLQLNRTTITYDNGQIVMNTTGSDAHIGNIVNIGDTWDNTKGQLINVEPNTTYTLSITNNSIAKNFITYYDKNKVSLKVDFNVPTQRTFTTPNDTKYISIRLGNGNSVDGGVYKFNVMLEKGTSSSTYEPYIGNSYPLYLGVENLSTMSSMTTTSGGNYNTSTGFFAYVQSGKTYTLSLNIASSNTSTGFTEVRCYTATSGGTNQGTIVSFNRLNGGGNITKTFTSSYNGYLMFSGAGMLANSEVFTDIKLVEGSTMQHISTQPIELCKIGTYQDYIYKDNGSWYLHKEIGKVVLDGSETTRYDATNKVIIYEESNIRNYNAGGIVYCNYYLGTANGGAPNQNLNAWNGNSHNINIKNNDISTLDDFKSWLSTHNTIVYYVLATPTNTLIEDTTLIEQLEELKNAISYKGQTNISQTNNDMPFILDLSALKENSDHLVIDNIGNIYSKPTLDLEGTGIVDIYLNDTQMFEVDLSEKNEIVIDTEKMEAYNPTDNTLANRQVTGDYSKFKLDSGENDLRFSGNLTKATITRYERWL